MLKQVYKAPSKLIDIGSISLLYVSFLIHIVEEFNVFKCLTINYSHIGIPSILETKIMSLVLCKLI